jgi:hypothetical protein
MGLGQSNKAQRFINRQINKQIAQNKEELGKVCKVVVFG